ncbi:MAG: GntR family transcriptional regulator [Saccharofermentanales bacterium]|jgi:DNA-binding transcriptional regulator YhcF (GntR family)
MAERKTDIPLYRILAQELSEQIASGELPAGTQLPTIRQLAGDKQVSVGTAKHAYQHLAEAGLIVTIQGSGSYVAANDTADTKSRKEQALEAIDQMLLQLSQLDFSLRDIQIFLELKMRQLEERFRNVRVAVVGESPELRSVILNDLSTIPNADYVRFLLSDIKDQPFRLKADFDLVVCEEKNTAELEQLVKGEVPVMQLALTLSPTAIKEFSCIPADTRVGILCLSHTFLDKMLADFSHYVSLEAEAEVYLFGGDAADFSDFLLRQELVLVPPHCTDFISRKEEQELRSALKGQVRILRYDLRVDRGSWLYISDAVAAAYKAAKQKLNRR